MYGIGVAQFVYYVRSFPRDKLQLRVLVSIFIYLCIHYFCCFRTQVFVVLCVCSLRLFVLSLTSIQFSRQRPDDRIDLDLLSHFRHMSYE